MPQLAVETGHDSEIPIGSCLDLRLAVGCWRLAGRVSGRRAIGEHVLDCNTAETTAVFSADPGLPRMGLDRETLAGLSPVDAAQGDRNTSGTI